VERIVQLDPDACYRAYSARDARFDGTFFVGVKTTGIYCRPICPARTPARERCAFYRYAIEAERDGFRACFRCRPERAPGTRQERGLSPTVQNAMARIQAGALSPGSVDALAQSLGTSARQLRRAMHAELGVSPLELAISHRIALARTLLLESALPVTDVAHVSGFSSLRRFNATFREHQGRAPSELRRKRAALGAPQGVELELEYRPPLETRAMLAFLEARAVRGLEHISNGVYRRNVCIGEHRGWIAVCAGQSTTLRLCASESLLPVLPELVRGVRRMFDLDADPLAIGAHFTTDGILSPLFRTRPGLRLPGALDAFEIAVRAVLGQKISVAAARTLGGRLVERFGEVSRGPHPGLIRHFPDAARIARADADELAAIGLTLRRARAVQAIARAVDDGSLALDAADTDPQAACERLEQIAGVGRWTAQYVALRGLSWPDAFPDGDLGIRKALGGIPASACRKLAERWRPWRAYAAVQLWASL